MKHIIILSMLLLTACVQPVEDERSIQAMETFNSMKPPIVLVGKDLTLNTWGVTLRDSTGRAEQFSNHTPLANEIGASYKVGDTLK